jgi:hypothetical protein
VLPVLVLASEELLQRRLHKVLLPQGLQHRLADAKVWGCEHQIVLRFG